jgi:hypothetical protein
MQNLCRDSLTSHKWKVKEIDAQILSSSNEGGQSHAIPDQKSFFTVALLDGLEKFGTRAKNNRKWEVTTSSLATAMKHLMSRMQTPEMEKPTCHVGGRSNFDTVIHTFTGVAHVMSCVDCDPNSALEHAELTITTVKRADRSIDDEPREEFGRKTPAPVPYEDVVPAGEYSVAARFPSGQFADATTHQLMQPPYTPCTVEVIP